MTSFVLTTPSEANQAPGLGTRFWIITAGASLARMSWLVIPFRIVYMTSQRQLTSAQATLVLTLFGIGWAITQPAAGMLADRCGRRAVIVTGTIMSSLAFLWFGSATTMTGLAVAGLLAGMTFDVYRPAIQALATEAASPAATAKAVCLLYWAMNVSRCLACLFGAAIFQHYPSLLFPAAAAICATTAAFMLKAAAGPPARKVSLRTPVPGVLRDRRLVLFTLVTACCYAIYLQTVVSMPQVFASSGFTTGQLGLVLTVGPLVIAVLQPVCLRWTRRMGLYPACATGAAAIGTGICLTGASGHPLAAAILAPLWAAGDIVFMTTATAIVTSMAPPHRRAAYFGLWGSAQGLGAVIAPVFAHLALTVGGTGLLWISCLACAAALSCAILVLRRSPHEYTSNAPSFQRLTPTEDRHLVRSVPHHRHRPHIDQLRKVQVAISLTSQAGLGSDRSSRQSHRVWAGHRSETTTGVASVKRLRRARNAMCRSPSQRHHAIHCGRPRARPSPAAARSP